MRSNWVVEPLPDGWCRAWKVAWDDHGRVRVGAAMVARTADVLWPEEEVYDPGGSASRGDPRSGASET
jgi:hypothetical protein